MCSYWGQWNAEELRDLHGIEENKDDIEFTPDEEDESLSYYEKNQCICRHGCSYCLL